MALAALILAACQTAAVQETAAPATEAQVAVTPAPEATAPAVETMPPTEAVTALPETTAQVPEGWQTFTEPTYGYSVSFPAEWEPCTETQYSRLFCERQEEPSGLGPPPRLYISVIPQGSTNADSEIYNFLAGETIQGFLALPVGGTQLKEPNATPPEYFTYTRLPDRTVAGRTAAVIENARVWEAPEGTKERVYLVAGDEVTYLIGTYSVTPEQQAVFEQVLDSVQLGP